MTITETKPSKKKGFCWHIHHNRLMEWCYDYEGRVCEIKHWKPKAEIKPRLRLFQFVKGELSVAFKNAKSEAERAKAIKAHQAEIEALHAKECPNCLWNGRELDFGRIAQILNFLKRVFSTA